MAKALYRDPVNGKISGVCAGLANLFGLEVWLVRLLVVSAALFSGVFFVIFIYIALAFMLEKQPSHYAESIKNARETHVKHKHWKQGQTPRELLSKLHGRITNLEDKVNKIEAHVTSEAFKVNKAFNKL